VLGGDDIAEAFPRVARWINELRKRPAVGKVLDDQERALAERE
jgi:glutathione S-transferase